MEASYAMMPPFERVEKRAQFLRDEERAAEAKKELERLGTQAFAFNMPSKGFNSRIYSQCSQCIMKEWLHVIAVSFL